MVSSLSSKPTVREHTLNEVKSQTVVTIKGIQTNDPLIRNRLLCFGFTEGRTVRISKRSPFGHTLCVELLEYSLALRLTEADAVCLLVE